MLIRPYSDLDLDQVVSLWRSCGLISHKNNPVQDIRRKLEVDPDLFLLGEQGDKVVATAMGGYEGHRGWVNYLAVDSEYRNRGIAKNLMQQVEVLLLQRGCPKINLQVRSSNTQAIDFYKSLGFQPDEVLSLGKRLVDD